MPTHRIYKGIHYVSDKKLNWKRRKRGTGFQYLDKEDKPLREKEIERIKKLSIPPAWVEVQICPDEKGHIQAVGFDAKQRKQYIYHPDWILYNQKHKFDSMIRFGEVLPVLRDQVAAHMRQHSLTRERILATIVWLLENTFIRIGNKAYAKDNKSYGLTTLREKHVEVEGNKVKFSFKGKSGVYHQHDISHPRIVQTIKQCIELPGYKLFNYLDDNDNRQRVDSKDVNEYLQSATGESMSAKDFRTWGGTTLAGDTLYQLGSFSEELSKQDAFSQTVDRVSDHLGNTTSVCKKYYIHPKIFSSYERKKLVPHFARIHKNHKRNPGKLSPSEKAAWTLIQIGT
ncbi:MAG: DNA topoisomerase IB [Patescibacteria group bacterium]